MRWLNILLQEKSNFRVCFNLKVCEISGSAWGKLSTWTSVKNFRRSICRMLTQTRAKHMQASDSFPGLFSPSNSKSLHQSTCYLISPLDISRGFHLIVFTAQTLLCDCISWEHSARHKGNCGLKGADSLSTPGHFWPSFVILAKQQILCVNGL